MAYLAQHKGVVDRVAERVIRDVAEWGHGGTRIAIETNEEEAIIALRDEIVARRKTETVPKL